MGKKILKISFIIVPTLALILFGFNNCGRVGQLSEESALTDSPSLGGGGSGGSDDAAADGDDVNSEKLGLEIALLSAEQVLYSMLSMATVPGPVPATVSSEYSARYGSLASGNSLSLTTAPLILSSTSMASAVCNSMITQDAALADNTRGFFNGINFSAGVTSITEAAFATSVRSMARAFWARSETPEELALFVQHKSEFINAYEVSARTQSGTTRALLTATCAAMLSSFEAITY